MYVTSMALALAINSPVFPLPEHNVITEAVLISPHSICKISRFLPQTFGLVDMPAMTLKIIPGNSTE